MRLPAKDSATWRALVTTVEATLSYAAGLLAIPEVAKYVATYRPELLVLPPIVAFTVSFLRNRARKDVDNY